MSEERFVDIEVKLAHQEQVVNELNEVVTQQQAEADATRGVVHIAAPSACVRSVRADADPEQDERPPHY